LGWLSVGEINKPIPPACRVFHPIHRTRNTTTTPPPPARTGNKQTNNHKQLPAPSNRIELVYQIVNSRAAYERKTPAAQKLGNRDQLTALAHAADGLLDAVGKHWDWMALEFYALPHLMGEEADYEIEESSEEEEGGEEKEKEEESEWEEDEADREWREAEEEARKKAVAAEAAKLPRKMEELDIIDGDGDLMMED
jgi:hypothetical protein